MSRTSRKVRDAKNISTNREATKARAIGCPQTPGYDNTVRRVDAGATIWGGKSRSPSQRPHFVILNTPKLPNSDAPPITYKGQTEGSEATNGKAR